MEHKNSYLCLDPNAAIFIPKKCSIANEIVKCNNYNYDIEDKTFNYAYNSNANMDRSAVNQLIRDSASNLHSADGIEVQMESDVNQNTDGNVYTILNDLRIKNLNRIIIAHLNINNLRNKIGMLSDIIVNKIDILLISETKIDASFPSANFYIPSFSPPYRLDRTSNGGGGGVLLFIRGDIPSKELKSYPINGVSECFFTEINMYKKNCL